MEICFWLILTNANPISIRKANDAHRIGSSPLMLKMLPRAYLLLIDRKAFMIQFPIGKNDILPSYTTTS